jgi:hypothetical protein
MSYLHHSNGRCDMDEKVLCFPSRMPFISDRIQPNLQSSQCEVCFNYISPVEGEIQSKKYYGLQVMSFTIERFKRKSRRF